MGLHNILKSRDCFIFFLRRKTGGINISLSRSIFTELHKSERQVPEIRSLQGIGTYFHAMFLHVKPRTRWRNDFLYLRYIQEKQQGVFVFFFFFFLILKSIDQRGFVFLLLHYVLR